MSGPAMHPAARALIERMATLALPPLWSMPAPEARAAFAQRHGRLVKPARVACRTTDRTIPGAPDVPLRLYHPPGAAGPVPCLVYFHGGGWVVGDLEMVDALCRDLCAQSGALVVSVDYRLAPEHPFPAPLEDGDRVLAVLRAEAGPLGIDPAAIFVAGDSAGGNLAAVMALREAAAGRALAGQVLIYPVTDIAVAHPTMERFATGLNLDAATMRWFGDSYVSDPAQRADWQVSPLYAPMDTPAAPALVITAGYDVLHDEGAAYADRLAAAGTPVEYACFATQLHGFATQTALSGDPYLLRDMIAGFVKRHSVRGNDR
ncbi:MAG: alpha/beta hydrolase [Rhodobacter sp.]|nr:alpha/beta hydrolase [Paracoccaceae bacterium]MCC0076565.1 alpha/beta hydrolase [Rhodobacter sp.]